MANDARPEELSDREPEDPLVPVHFKLPPNAVTGSDGVVVIEIARSLQDLLETARRTGRDEALEVVRAAAGTPAAANASPGQPFALSDEAVYAFSGNTQRRLLRAVNGKGHVPIAEVLRAVYGSTDNSNQEALLKAKDRLNGKLAEKGMGCELKREGETLILSRV
jgi:hypothetical protein